MFDDGRRHCQHRDALSTGAPKREKCHQSPSARIAQTQSQATSQGSRYSLALAKSGVRDRGGDWQRIRVVLTIVPTIFRRHKNNFHVRHTPVFHQHNINISPLRPLGFAAHDMFKVHDFAPAEKKVYDDFIIGESARSCSDNISALLGRSSVERALPVTTLNLLMWSIHDRS